MNIEYFKDKFMESVLKHGILPLLGPVATSGLCYLFGSLLNCRFIYSAAILKGIFNIGISFYSNNDNMVMRTISMHYKSLLPLAACSAYMLNNSSGATLLSSIIAVDVLAYTLFKTYVKWSPGCRYSFSKLYKYDCKANMSVTVGYVMGILALNCLNSQLSRLGF